MVLPRRSGIGSGAAPHAARLRLGWEICDAPTSVLHEPHAVRAPDRDHRGLALVPRPSVSHQLAITNP